MIAISGGSTLKLYFVSLSSLLTPKFLEINHLLSKCLSCNALKQFSLGYHSVVS